MKVWAKKLIEMADDEELELTEDEVRAMMEDIAKGAAEGFNIRVISAEELTEVEAMFPHEPTLH